MTSATPYESTWHNVLRHMCDEFFSVSYPSRDFLDENKELDYDMIRSHYFNPTRVTLKEGPNFTTVKLPPLTDPAEIINIALCVSFQFKNSL